MQPAICYSAFLPHSHLFSVPVCPAWLTWSRFTVVPTLGALPLCSGTHPATALPLEPHTERPHPSSKAGLEQSAGLLLSRSPRREPRSVPPLSRCRAFLRGLHVAPMRFCILMFSLNLPETPLHCVLHFLYPVAFALVQTGPSQEYSSSE